MFVFLSYLQSPQKALCILAPPLTSDYLSKPPPLLTHSAPTMMALYLFLGHSCHMTPQRPRICLDVARDPSITSCGFCSNVTFSLGTSLTNFILKTTSPVGPNTLYHFSLHFFSPNHLSSFDRTCFYYFLFAYCLLPTTKI